MMTTMMGCGESLSRGREDGSCGRGWGAGGVARVRVDDDAQVKMRRLIFLDATPPEGDGVDGGKGAGVGFRYRAARESASGYYEEAFVETRAEATYTTADGEASLWFDTQSAFGVTTFDARTCVAIDFVPLERWRREKTVFDAMTRLRIFREHRVRKSFMIMVKYARERKFKRARRALAESSAIFGLVFAPDAIACALKIHKINASIVSDVRMFRRGEMNRGDNGADDADRGFDHGFDDCFGGGAAKPTPATFNAIDFQRVFETQAHENRDRIRNAVSGIQTEIALMRESIENRFLVQLEQRLRPMVVAARRYHRRHSGSHSTHGRGGAARTSTTSSHSTESNTFTHTTSSSLSSTARANYPYTEQGLTRRLRAKLEKFERAAWLSFRAACVTARDASLDEIDTVIRDASTADINGDYTIPSLFSTKFDFNASALDPSADDFVNSLRFGCAAWQNGFVTSGLLDESEEDVMCLNVRIERAARAIRDVFATAQAAAVTLSAPLRARAEHVAAESLDYNSNSNNEEEDNGLISQFISISSRAHDLKRDMDKCTSVREKCVDVDMSSVKRTLRPPVDAALAASASCAVDRVSDASQNIATQLTRLKLMRASATTEDDVATTTRRECVRTLRENAKRIENAYAEFRARGVSVPELHVAAFVALEPELESLAGCDDENEQENDEPEDKDEEDNLETRSL